MRCAPEFEIQNNVTVFSVRYMLRPNKELNKTVLHEVRAEVEDTVEHKCFLCEFYAEAEETDECECVLCELNAEVEDEADHDCVLYEVRYETA
jgi:hypothetical protein